MGDQSAGMPDGPYRAGTRVIETDLGDESILLDPDTQQMFSLRETGRVVWKALPAPDVASLVMALRAEYDVDADQAADDVGALLSDLLEAGLVEAGAPADEDA